MLVRVWILFLIKFYHRLPRLLLEIFYRKIELFRYPSWVMVRLRPGITKWTSTPIPRTLFEYFLKLNTTCTCALVVITFDKYSSNVVQTFSSVIGWTSLLAKIILKFPPKTFVFGTPRSILKPKPPSYPLGVGQTQVGHMFTKRSSPFVTF